MADAKDAAQQSETAVTEEVVDSLSAFLDDVGTSAVPVGKNERKIDSDRRESVKDGVSELLSSISKNNANVVSGKSLDTIRNAISEIDKKLSAQVKDIIHHDAFTKVEGAWRGLKYLVDNSKTNHQLKIKVLNVDQKELFDDLEEHRGRWQQSRLFEMVYKDDYDQWGGEPVGALVGDFHFDQSQESLESLADLSKVAAASHAPLVTAMSEQFFGKNSWEDVKESIKDVSVHLQGKEYAAWREFRDNQDSRYVGLTLPKMLARRPYSQSGDAGDGGFAFEEANAGQYAEEYVWMNAAYAMAANINESFSDYGWATAIRGIESGGAVDGLPLHSFETEDGSVDVRCPTDINIGETLETALSDNGFMALVHKKNSTRAAFIGGQSAYKPATYANDPDASTSEQLSARLPYTFAVSRIAHYLKAIGRQMVGQGMEEAQIERKLNEWISQYVLLNKDAPDSAKAEKPLAAAKIKVVPVEGKPGSYQVDMRIRPHYQIEDLNIDVSLVADVEK